MTSIEKFLNKKFFEKSINNFSLICAKNCIDWKNLKNKDDLLSMKLLSAPCGIFPNRNLVGWPLSGHLLLRNFFNIYEFNILKFCRWNFMSNYQLVNFLFLLNPGWQNGFLTFSGRTDHCVGGGCAARSINFKDQMQPLQNL